MKQFYTFILLLVISSLNAQNNIKNDWEKENLKGKPKSVSIKSHDDEEGIFYETKYNSKGFITYTEDALSKTKFRYNSKGQLIAKVGYSNYDDIVAYTEDFIYDDKGREIGGSVTGAFGDSYSKIEYNKDSYIHKFFDLDGKLTSKCHYLYYPNSTKIIKEVCDYGKAGGYTKSSTYDGEILLSDMYVNKDGSYREYIYDTVSGRISTYKMKNVTKNYSYELDKYGNVKTATIKDSKGKIIGKDIWKITYYE